jgi:hypothetical protein
MHDPTDSQQPRGTIYTFTNTTCLSLMSSARGKGNLQRTIS